jgi:transcriptional regulator PpsR
VSKEIGCFQSPASSIGDLDAQTAARLLAACGDVAMVIDRHGVIRDVAVSSREIEVDPDHMVDRRWIDTVAEDSRQKVEELLRDALEDGELRWREINHVTSKGSALVRYLALDLGQNGKVIALGRDLARYVGLQQRLLHAQQETERQILRARQNESLYRLLFQVSAEAILIVEAATRRIVEANAQAGAMLGLAPLDLAGQTFAKLFHAEAREAVAVLLSDNANRGEAVRLRTLDGRSPLLAAATPFRQDRAAYLLVRLQPLRSDTVAENDGARKLVRVLNRMPDPFVMTDAAFNILEANLAFLERSQCATIEAARAAGFPAMIGRPTIDMAVLAQTLREHGWVRRFETVFNPLYGAPEPVEISAVGVQEGLETLYGFTLHARTPLAPAAGGATALAVPQTAEQVKDLVGRVPLRTIVRETTDVIERLCIEAALQLTENNRASAAEMLGLSRQSLYSKLDRYGISNEGETLESE